MAQFCVLLSTLIRGNCLVQMRNPIDLSEIVDLVVRAGVNSLGVFSPLLVGLLKKSQVDPNLLALLKGLIRIIALGAPVPPADAECAWKKEVDIFNVFSTTEAPGTILATREILELVVLSESIDCPGPTFRQPDGHFHTGDLWERTADGGYLYRGRDDDWIKMENACRCDTKAIEENVRTTCGDLISDCVVVGSWRPSPVLFVEARGEGDEDKLKETILQRVQEFHSRLLAHEKITSTKMIVVVPQKTLPRTAKGNIRRKAVEDTCKDTLDGIFGM
ncbi:hypothetical protein V5O48_014166 [Marasmius crinis-equi]|uniref:Uncharacterized protein n=1 Tax=Marasmius crinis-equi TaxID=585013 RepID=A0ABR3EY58_9AGAR